jgi:hypothetical protein
VKPLDPIRAEIAGGKCNALGLQAAAVRPDMIRLPLHAYRGAMLALSVRSIGEASKFTVRDSAASTPVLARRSALRPSGGMNCTEAFSS